MTGSKQETFSVTVDADGAGTRLDAYLAAVLPDLSRSRLKPLILEGHVHLAGETISEPSYRVKPGQTFAIIVPDIVAPIPIGQALDLDIQYEDADLIVIDKPAGLVVHPAPGNPDRTLVNALIAHCGDQLTGIGGVSRPGIVHRLDKDTSGLMVAAKTARAHASLTRQFAERAVDRAYTAVVWGVPRPAAGKIEGAIGRSPRNRKKMAVVGRGGKPALTRYKLVRAFGNSAGGIASVVECRLATGRTHQIRVHMAHVGHALIGDPLYGRNTVARRTKLPADLRERVAGFERQALHAHLIGFAHPANHERLTFESPLSIDISMLIDSLEEVETSE